MINLVKVISINLNFKLLTEMTNLWDLLDDRKVQDKMPYGLLLQNGWTLNDKKNLGNDECVTWTFFSCLCIAATFVHSGSLCMLICLELTGLMLSFLLARLVKVIMVVGAFNFWYVYRCQVFCWILCQVCCCINWELWQLITRCIVMYLRPKRLQVTT